MKRVTIAGGGLSGLSLGIALRSRGVPVRLMEATTYPRHRVCGEFLSGIAPAELDALSIRDLLTDAEHCRSTVWFDGASELIRRNLPQPAMGISRYHLDAALARRFRDRGGELQTSTRWNQWGNGVVWATGRPRNGSGWLGLKAHFESLELRADLEVHLANCAYVGLTRVEGGQVNVCGLFRRKQAVVARERFAGALVAASAEAGLDELADRLRGARVVQGSLKGVNHFHLGWQSPGTERLSIGDAAAMIPPFTGNGMTMALQSALAAVEPLQAWSANELDWDEAIVTVQKRLESRFRARLAWARLIQGILMNSHSRSFAGWLLKTGCLSFSTIYSRVR